MSRSKPNWTGWRERSAVPRKWERVEGIGEKTNNILFAYITEAALEARTRFRWEVSTLGRQQPEVLGWARDAKTALRRANRAFEEVRTRLLAQDAADRLTGQRR